MEAIVLQFMFSFIVKIERNTVSGGKNYVTNSKSYDHKNKVMC